MKPPAKITYNNTVKMMGDARFVDEMRVTTFHTSGLISKRPETDRQIGVLTVRATGATRTMIWGETEYTDLIASTRVRASKLQMDGSYVTEPGAYAWLVIDTPNGICFQLEVAPYL